MKQRYKERVAYLWKKKPRIKSATQSYADADTHEAQSIPFYCSVVNKSRRLEVPLSNSYKTVTETVLLTDAQLDFAEFDRVSFTPTPENNVNQEDFNSIISATSRPMLEKGNKYRNNDYVTWEIRIS